VPHVSIKEHIDLLGEEGAAKRLKVPPKVCLNETCPRNGEPFLFHRRRDGSISPKMPHTKNVQFCCRQCNLTQRTREYRRVARLARKYGFKSPKHSQVTQARENGITLDTLERLMVLVRMQKGLEEQFGVPLQPEDLIRMAEG
jgi:hypothetical protein